jgi:ParB family chromosome partitioning protein
MQIIKVNELTPHPQNDFFFDDISGDKWQEFLQSVKTSGIIEPVVVTQDKIIVSGHQRIRACSELKINEVMCEVRVYDDENKVIKDLIETNLRQRGNIGGSTVKMGRILDKLDEIYGVKRGGDKVSEKAKVHFEPLVNPTKKDRLDGLGINSNKAKRAQKLSGTIPQIQELLISGDLSSAAGLVISELSKEEQQELLESFGGEIIEGTQKQMKEYVTALSGIPKLCLVSVMDTNI